MSELRPDNEFAEIDRALQGLADTLLQTAVSHTEVWKRGIFGVPRSEVPSLMESLNQAPFKDLMIQPGEPIPYFEDAGEEPILASASPRVSLCVEDFDHRRSSNWRETTLDFNLTYINEAKTDYAQVRLQHILGQHALNRLVFMPRYAETGYEGHGFEYQPVNPAQLQKFFELLTTYVGPQVPEESFTEMYKKIVYVDVDTEERFYYDETRKTHVSANGVAMEDFSSPLSVLDDELDPQRGKRDRLQLKETGRFRIEHLDKPAGT